ncbi:RluA family pseudouridine synthase [Dietzia sp. NPDC055343]
MVSRPAAAITVDDEHAGRRLDKFLRSHLKGVPAGLLFELLRKGRLRVNGRRTEQNYRLVKGDVIEVPALDVEAPATVSPRPPSALLEQMRRCVLYEDADLLIVDKPAGVAVHRGTDVPAGVIETLRHLRPGVPELELAHRLDRDTSGVLVLAKTHSMLRHLHEMLRDREDEIERHYLAIVSGRWPEDVTALDAPLLRRAAEVVVHTNGQRAETHVEVRRRVGNRATLVDVRLLTGRKHQIRVHLQHAGHPIAGDDRYGDLRFNALVEERGGRGLHLHATKMVIPLPDGTELVVAAPMPGKWERLLNKGI